MSRVLNHLSRSPFSPPDRRWVQALLAESAAIESPWDRLRWLMGAAILLLNHGSHSLASLITPVSLLCVAATAVFGVMAFIEYEGLAIEDDWYPLITAAFAAALIWILILNLRRQAPEIRP